MAQVVAEVIEALREPIRKTRAEIIQAHLPTVFGVRSQFVQLFQNLIENSIKFKKPKVAPKIDIHCEDEGEFWKFFIADNGIGFDPKFSERIFIMFQRLHPQEEYAGTGIGLAVCKKIVEFHGGKIGADSIKGEGSTFYFIIPKKERVTSRVAHGIQRMPGINFRESA